MTTVEEKLSKNKYELDESSHISVDQEKCRVCTSRYCLTVCPAKVYVFDDETGALLVNHAGCLECGTCIAACLSGGLDWRMPVGGMGIVYRYA